MIQSNINNSSLLTLFFEHLYMWRPLCPLVRSIAVTLSARLGNTLRRWEFGGISNIPDYDAEPLCARPTRNSPQLPELPGFKAFTYRRSHRLSCTTWYIRSTFTFLIQHLKATCLGESENSTLEPDRETHNFHSNIPPSPFVCPFFRCCLAKNLGWVKFLANQLCIGGPRHFNGP